MTGERSETPDRTSEAMPAVVATAAGVRVRVRVRPGASRQGVLGRTRLAGGEAAVLVAVSAPPEDGKANAAVAAVLAKLWRVPKTGIRPVVGATARTKLLEVSGDPVELFRKLSLWFDSLSEA